MNINEFIIGIESTETDYVTDEELRSYENFILSVAKDVVFSKKSRDYIKKTINKTPEEIIDYISEIVTNEYEEKLKEIQEG